MPRPSCLLVITALLLAATAHSQAPPKVTLLDIELPVQHWSPEYRKTHGTSRLVHAITGEPVPGAELFAVPETNHPLPGEFRSLFRATADRDGFAVLPIGEAWLMARATGLGPTMELTYQRATLPIAPAFDIPIRPVDWLGRPMPGATLGFCGGCGHTPDLATAIVGRDGIAWLRGVDPHGSFADLYPNTAPVLLSYWSTAWVPGDAPEEFAYDYGEVLHGTVLRPDGEPAVLAVVGTNVVHRGPWTQTDGKGQFRLFGLQPGDSFFVVHEGRHIECDWPAAMPCELRLPVPDGNPYQNLVERVPEADVEEFDIEVQHACEHGETIAEARSLWVGNARREYLEGREFDRLPAGSYAVRCTHPDFVTRELTVEVKAEPGQSFVFTMQRLPTVQVHVRGLPADGEVTLIRREASIDVGGDVDRDLDQPLVLPVRDDEPFAVRLRHPGTQNSRWFQFRGQAALAQREITVGWFAPTMVRAQIHDERGQQVDAFVKLLPRQAVLDNSAPFDVREIQDLVAAPAGTVAIPSEADQLCFLFVRPTDAALPPRLLAVPMPARSDDARVDLGTIVMARAPQLRLLAADGKSPAAAEATLLRAGYGCFHEHRLPRFALAADGSWLGPDLRPGDAVLVRAEASGVLPLRHVITAASANAATTVLLPSGSLALDVRDEQGQPVRCTVLLRECAFPANGDLTLAQLPRGPLRLFVAAMGHRSACIEVELGSTPPPPIAVVLPKH